MLGFRVAKLAKSFGPVRLAESLVDFRYVLTPIFSVDATLAVYEARSRNRLLPHVV